MAHGDQGPVFQTLDSAIHRIKIYPVDTAQLVSLILIRWIVIYPVDNAIQRLNNWGKTSNVKATVKRGRET